MNPFSLGVVRRFHDKVERCPVTGCHHWRGGVSRGGQGKSRKLPYGSFRVDQRLVLRAHVYVAWLFGLLGEPCVPVGMQLDHECENSLCVNPLHLRLVPSSVNQEYRRGVRRRQGLTWAERYAMRGVGCECGVLAVEPRHV